MVDGRYATAVLLTVIVNMHLSCCLGWSRGSVNRHRSLSICARSSLRMAMDYVKLGDSDLLVSKICLGTMTWGEQNTIDEGVEQLNYAFGEAGINFLDTAEMYPVPTKPETQGRTDKTVAKWLKGVDRSKVILATKVAGNSDRITWLPGRNGSKARVSAEQIKVSVDESLKRLETDYIDLLQIHWPDRYVPIFGQTTYNTSLERDAISFEEQLSTLSDIVKSGKVRYIGVSNETPYGVMKFCELARHHGLPKVVSIQNSYSLIVRTAFESGLTEVCCPRNENIGLLAYSPLAGGLLSGKYAREDCPPKSRLNMFPGYMARYKQSLAQEAVKEYVTIASTFGLTPTELALAWCYKQPHVASSIIGATTMAQLKENINSYKKIPLITDEVSSKIEDVYKRYKDPASIM